jgi:hypothetical protein
LKVLSVRQPWAWALIFGGKDIENRSWSTKYRGPIVIHASKSLTKKEYDWFVSYVVIKAEARQLNLIDIPRFAELERGKVIGTVDLIDVVRDSESPWFEGKRAWHGGTYTKENYGWVVTNPKPWTPLIRKGSLGLQEYKGPIQLTDKVDYSKLALAYGRQIV